MRFISKTISTALAVLFVLEVTTGFEPVDNGVADRGLTTWLRHHVYNADIISHLCRFVNRFLKILLTDFFDGIFAEM